VCYLMMRLCCFLMGVGILWKGQRVVSLIVPVQECLMNFVGAVLGWVKFV